MSMFTIFQILERDVMRSGKILEDELMIILEKLERKAKKAEGKEKEEEEAKETLITLEDNDDDNDSEKGNIEGSDNESVGSEAEAESEDAESSDDSDSDDEEEEAEKGDTSKEPSVKSTKPPADFKKKPKIDLKFNNFYDNLGTKYFIASYSLF
jgi:hypothetical protein